MKKLMIVLVFGAFVSAAFPAELRILGGGTFSRSTEPLGGVWFPEVSPRVASLTGFTVGGGITFSLVRYVALEMDCLYLQKGTMVESWWMDGTLLGRSARRINELSFPVLLKLRLSPGTGPYLLGGAEFAFVLNHEPRNMDSGLVLGVGFRKQVGTMAFSIEGRYHLGTRDLLTDETIMRKTRSAVILFGFSI
jgi:hypothetical protein